MDMQTEESRGRRPGAIVAGAILLVVGMAMFLDTTGAIDIHFGRLLAPLVLITIGTSMVLDRSVLVAGYRSPDEARDWGRRHRRRGGAGGGIWLIGVGCWLLVSQNHLFGLSFHNSWPLFIVLSGIIMVIRGIK